MTAPSSVCLRWSAPDHQRLWSGSSWFCLCFFFRVLASDRHWALWVDSSKAVVPVLVFVALWFILRGDSFYVLPRVILFLCFFSPFSIAITSLWDERANLSAFRTFVQFVLVWFCRFPLPLGV